MFILLGCLSLKNPPAYLVFVKKEIFNEEKNTRLVRKRPAFSQDSAGAIPTKRYLFHFLIYSITKTSGSMTLNSPQLLPIFASVTKGT